MKLCTFCARKNNFVKKDVYTTVDWPQQTYSNKELGYRKLKPREISQLAEYHEVPVSTFEKKPAAQAPAAEGTVMKLVRFLWIERNGELQSMQKLDGVVVKKVSVKKRGRGR